VGLGISQTNADSQWNPVYNTFHRIFDVNTKRFIGSSVNVNLTRHTCDQRSSRVVESKRRALENHFPEWICYMFPLSKCTGEWDVGLCTFWVLAKRETLRNAKFRFFLRAKHVFFRKSSLLCDIFFITVVYKLLRCDHWVWGFKSFWLPMNW